MAILSSTNSSSAYSLSSSDSLDKFFGSRNQVEILNYNGSGNLKFIDVSTGDRVTLNSAIINWQTKVIGNVVTLTNKINSHWVELGSLVKGETVTVEFSDNRSLTVTAEQNGSYTATPSTGVGLTQTSTSVDVVTNLDLLGGSIQNATVIDASYGIFNYNDSAIISDYIRINNFGANDSININNGGSTHLSVSSYGADVTLTVNNSSIVSQITLVGILNTPYPVIASLSALNALSVGDVTYS